MSRNLPPKPPRAPVLTGGRLVDAAWNRLLDRAGPRPGLPLTDDPDLHLLTDGIRVDARTRTGDVHTFTLRRVPTEARLVSRAAAPQELGLARDPRCLGVAVRRIVIRQRARFRTIEADDKVLADDFHAFEADKGLRWTDGDARIPPEIFAGLSGSVEVVLHIGAMVRYVEGLVVSLRA